MVATLIGPLPGYATAGVLAPWLLAALRFLQGVGLGGEWGGAALIATENAPDGRRAWFGMFPQLGPPIGFFIATGLFLALLIGFGEAAFADWAWRVPFLASAILVAIGLYVRVAVEETPAFKAAMALDKRIAVPLGAVLRDYWRPLIQGSLAIVVCYALFYIATVYMIGYGVRSLGLSRVSLLEMLCVAVVFMAVATPISAALADRVGRRPVLLVSAVIAAAVGLMMPALAGAGRRARLSLARAWRDGPDLRAAWRALAGIVPDRGALYRRGERLQSRRHSRRVAGAVAGPASRGGGRHRLGRLLHRRRRRDQLPRDLKHARDP
jgi:MFS family permease